MSLALFHASISSDSFVQAFELYSPEQWGPCGCAGHLLFLRSEKAIVEKAIFYLRGSDLEMEDKDVEIDAGVSLKSFRRTPEALAVTHREWPRLPYLQSYCICFEIIEHLPL